MHRLRYLRPRLFTTFHRATGALVIWRVVTPILALTTTDLVEMKLAPAFFALLALSLPVFASHYSNQPSYYSSPVFSHTLQPAPMPYASSYSIYLRKPSYYYYAYRPVPTAKAFYFPVISVVWTPGGYVRDEYERFRQPPFPQRLGIVGTRWERGVYVRDYYEGYRQPPFTQLIPPLFLLPPALPMVSPPPPPVFPPTPPTVFPTPQPSAREIGMHITHAGGFSPSVISVNQGDRVRIRATTDFPTHLHGIVIGAPYNINRRVLSTTAPDVIEFTAHTRGSFAVSCGCGSEHFALGGKEFTGTLVVS